jgi:hypothetical protein
MIRFIPSGLILRFGFDAFVVAGTAGLDLPRIFAHLSRCAALIRLRVAAENFRCLRGADSDAAAGCAGPPLSIARSSATRSSRRFLCALNPSMAALMNSSDIFVGMSVEPPFSMIAQIKQI